MEHDNYLKHLHDDTSLCEAVIREIEMSLKRFHSFLNSESVADLGAVDRLLLHRYAGTLSDMRPPTLHRHLLIICRYLGYAASTQREKSDSPQSSAPPVRSSDRRPECDSGSSATMNFTQFWMRRFPSSMSKSYESTVYIPSFDDIRRLVDTANSHERTQPVGALAYVVASSGLRKVELENLRVTDIVAGLARIWSRDSSMYRYVPLSPRALQCLALLHKRFPDSEFVFGDKAPAYLHTLAICVSLLARNSGAKNIRLHSLRRSMLERLHSMVKTSREETAIKYVTGRASVAVNASEPPSDLETVLEIATRLLERLWAALDGKAV